MVEQTEGQGPMKDLIERSSLGTRGAKKMRNRTPREVSTRIVERASRHAQKKEKPRDDPER